MEKTISGEEKCFENRNSRCTGIQPVFLLAFATGASAGAVEGLRIESLTPGKLRVERTAPDSTPSHFLYRINWGPADDILPSPNNKGNNYSKNTTFILMYFRPGVKYKVRVREGENPFSETKMQRADDYHSSTQTRGMVANRDKMQDRNDRPWRCQGEKLPR